MRRFGLIGFPLGHSFSKKYFTEKFASENIGDATYELYPIENVLKVKDLLKANHEICGLNVTIPHKQSIIPLLNDLSDDAKQIGAVNCISIKNNLLKGFNTDAPAFEFCLTKFLQPHHKQALVIGNGGSAAAVKFILKKLSIPFITVTRKATEPTQLEYSQLNDEVINQCPVIINTTPLGMYPQVEFSPRISYKAITKQHLLFDLVYNPQQTSFMNQGLQQGSTVISGLEMFYKQAELSWEIWNS